MKIRNLEEYKQTLLPITFSKERTYVYFMFLMNGQYITDEEYCKKAGEILIDNSIKRGHIGSILIAPDESFVPPCTVNGYSFELDLDKDLLYVKKTSENPGNLKEAVDKVLTNIVYSTLPAYLKIKYDWDPETLHEAFNIK